jgi:hypothetical protein
MTEINVHSMIKERFNNLPPKLQEAIASTDVANKLRTISQKHKLLLDQGQILENETYMVLLGIEQAENYKQNLKKELNISEDTATKIANDVGREIFLSIRNTLRESTIKTIESEPKPTNKPNESFETQTFKDNKMPSIKIENTTQQNKLDQIVKNQSKEIKITPIEYNNDPYREPIE